MSTKPPLAGTSVDRAYKAAAHDAGRVLADAGHDVVEAAVPYALRFGIAAISWWVAGTDDDAEALDRTRLQPSIRRHAALGASMKRRGWARPERMKLPHASR